MSLRKRWRQSQYLADQFWKRWRREYLPTLQIRPKWNVEQRNVSVGDLVLVVEDGVKRSKWKTGRVESVMPGLDWRVIFARVKTSTGSYVCALKRKLVVELPGILQVGENVAISPTSRA